MEESDSSIGGGWGTGGGGGGKMFLYSAFDGGFNQLSRKGLS